MFNKNKNICKFNSAEILKRLTISQSKFYFHFTKTQYLQSSHIIYENHFIKLTALF